MGAARPKAEVAAQHDWTLVKRVRHADGDDTYDVWAWSLAKMKWVRLSNSACGYGTLEDADRDAKRMSDETQAMLDRNRKPPAPPLA